MENGGNQSVNPQKRHLNHEFCCAKVTFFLTNHYRH